ncbi:oligoendopeptidase F [Pleomorphovibrio marinus]|uniref:oligoendopeptidase F n=1 Tax=Pleomorphovibrio marinus TaxID=2164132 RepID=UPI001300A7B8|nr:oligoendopeptidase F [Pleomorphovibrio marinus]
MKKLLVLIFLVTCTFFLAAQAQDRDEIEEKYKWDLTHIFPSDEAWTEAKDQIKERSAQVERFKGKLTSSAEDLADALEFMADTRKEFSRLGAYASMKSDQDTRVSKYTAMKLELQQIGSSFSSTAAFIEPEILQADPKTLTSFVQNEPRLAPFDKYIHDLLRRRTHKRSEEVERVIAQASQMAGTASNVRSIFANADFPYPEMEIDGKTIKLTPANFSKHRASEDRALREKVFDSFFGKLDEFQRTFGAKLYGNLQSDIFYSKVRNYESTLESALDGNNIPKEVYHNLIANVHQNLPTFHRYLQLRKRMMDLEELHYYDLYAPLVGEVDLEFTVEEAKDHVLKSLEPLGMDYVEVVDRAFNEHWIDMYPNEGKRSGAYSQGGVYDVHPYILMNYNEKYNDVSTLTHELGHTMHSYLSNQNQPYSKAGYSIFVAEVASTVNEALLNDYFLKNMEDKAVRLAILGNFLETAKGTLFRQTQFAEFELKIHEMVENGEVLTGEDFDEFYLGITKKYYGHDEGICIVDENVKSEWAFIPHFYYNYYVYQYATSFTASQAIAEKLASEEKAVKRYREFLSAGGSEYPVELLKEAGVDMTSSVPFDLTIARINAVMDEMESILDAWE